MIAMAVAYIANRISAGFWSAPIGWMDPLFVLLEVVFFLGSRDTLEKYVNRGKMLFGTAASTRRKLHTQAD